jgi:tRNA pseudouridine55 synthase
VLIAGVGKGTKSLNDFLTCTKSYETVVLFGAETDTYDRLGKIVRRAPYEHITREAVEKALDQFRGKIMQRPPIFSALRIEGKRLYEYAREGKMPPVEIKSRPVETVELNIVEWYEPGTHEYKWPEEEMTGDEKIIAEKLLDKEAEVPVGSESADQEASSAKRKTPPAADSPKEQDAEAAKKQKVSEDGAAQVAAPEPVAPEAATAAAPAEQTDEPRPQPAAVKIHMTVTSGFYVRSLAHDLGKAVGSCGLMSSLVRSRQAQFDLQPENILEYKDLEQGEEVWGPKVQKFLEDWESKRAAKAEAEENAKAQQ